ncbi:hypothetical protein [Cohnella sp. REN36]|uniref:hypothetical protein n=1 Tax=Cohnella sp. REN36 TaxID=2887347 RepID=UPI001D13B428|nr:hypothetical protein [Cohnella sp. REN36]MCC3373780.1 hypothetical protein [Cohnella sp. REN36]
MITNPYELEKLSETLRAEWECRMRKEAQRRETERQGKRGMSQLLGAILQLLH